MYDAIFLLTIFGFFALCVAYIRGCDRIIGPEDEAESDLDADLEHGAPTPVGTPPAERAA